MLTHLTLRNFRAFKAQQFNFSRINVLVGPNNSGKSSVLSAINLLAQTAIDNDANVPLVLRGRFDDLGTFHDVVHGNNPNTPLSLEFGIGEYAYHIDFKYRSQRREIEITRHSISNKKTQIFEYALRKKETYELRYGNNSVEELLPGSVKRRPEFMGLTVVDRGLNIIYEPQRSKEISEDTKKVVQRIRQDMNAAQRELRMAFAFFDSLSPFRDAPTRTFLFSGAVPGRVGRTGSNAIDILVSDNFRRGSEKYGLIEGVSRWLSSTSIAKAIKVKALTSRHYEICVVGYDNKDHNLCDVGFGCSQVLPVLIGSLNMMSGKQTQSDPIFVVEEPEIHLHPNAQAELGTFLVDLFKKSGQVFIETHSANLIIRLQRHVAKGDLAPADLRIFYVSGGTVPPPVVIMEVDEKGFFKHDWPGGFFPQRQEESLALAQAAAQKEKRSD